MSFAGRKSELSRMLALPLLLLVGTAMGQDSDGAAPVQRQNSAATTQPAVKATLEDFQWLTGRWVGELGRIRTEEIWSGPDAGVMMGMFRLVSNDGKTNVIEIMTLREVDGTVELCFRHLTPDMVCWEEPDKPAVMRIGTLSPNEVVFVDPTGDSPKKGVPLRQVWKHDQSTLWFEVYAVRDGVEKKILEGRAERRPLDSL